MSVGDAMAFASWIGRRIPTEAEWESAARTDMGYKYTWGNEFNADAFNIEKSGLCDTSSVDEYDPFLNEFKIADMLGNVLEWTSTVSSSSRVIRSGGWVSSEVNCSVSKEGYYDPSGILYSIGFRVCR